MTFSAVTDTLAGTIPVIVTAGIAKRAASGLGGSARRRRAVKRKPAKRRVARKTVRKVVRRRVATKKRKTTRR